MAHKVLTDAKIWVDAYDLSGDMNAVSCEYIAAAVDDTNFGDTSEVNLGGVRSIALEASGRFNAAVDTADPVLQSKIGADDTPVSVSPDGEAEGDVAYTFNALFASYVPGGTHGEMMAFEVSAGGDGELARGTIMVSPSAAISASGDSTDRQVGAVAAGESMYATLHVLAASGSSPTLDVVVRSDDASGMASPTTQLTFAQATGATSEHLSVAGPITDDWWDISYTLGGSSPSFTFIVIIGIR